MAEVLSTGVNNPVNDRLNRKRSSLTKSLMKKQHILQLIEEDHVLFGIPIGANQFERMNNGNLRLVSVDAKNLYFMKTMISEQTTWKLIRPNGTSTNIQVDFDVLRINKSHKLIRKFELPFFFIRIKNNSGPRSQQPAVQQLTEHIQSTPKAVRSSASESHQMLQESTITGRTATSLLFIEKPEESTDNFDLALANLVKMTTTAEIMRSFNVYLKVLKKQLLGLVGVGGFGFAVAFRDRNGVQSVLKLVPLIDEESIQHMRREIIISRELSKLRDDDNLSGFPDFFSCAVIKSPLNRVLQELLKGKKDVEHLYDTRVKNWLSIEMDYGGTRLIEFARPPEGKRSLGSHAESVSILGQLLLALTSAESNLEFEHRDCHWENILIDRPVNHDEEIELKINDVGKIFKTYGLATKIIDFGLARCQTEFGIQYLNLEKYYPSILQQTGTMQYSVYKKMAREIGDDWSAYKPRTNALWVEYLIDKLLTRINYVNDEQLDPWKLFLENLQENLRQDPAMNTADCLFKFHQLLPLNYSME